MVGWRHRLDGHEFGQTPGSGDGQGSLVGFSPWGHKESETTDQLNWTELSQNEYIQIISPSSELVHCLTEQYGLQPAFWYCHLLVHLSLWHPWKWPWCTVASTNLSKRKNFFCYNWASTFCGRNGRRLEYIHGKLWMQSFSGQGPRIKWLEDQNKKVWIRDIWMDLWEQNCEDFYFTSQYPRWSIIQRDTAN